jgi:hypothetical protein
MEASDIDFNAFDQPFSSNVAKQLDEQFKDDGAYLRHEFNIPKKADLNCTPAHGGTFILKSKSKHLANFP